MLYSSAALICLVAITCVFDSMAYTDIQEMTDEERHFDRSHSMTADDIVEDHDQDLAKSK